jgi:hypothetical protein
LKKKIYKKAKVKYFCSTSFIIKQLRNWVLEIKLNTFIERRKMLENKNISTGNYNVDTSCFVSEKDTYRQHTFLLIFTHFQRHDRTRIRFQ